MTVDSLNKDIRMWLHQRYVVPLEVIGDQSQLFRDLGITGDDAEELIAEFGERFGVDMGSFDFDRYFGGEFLLKHFAWLIGAVKLPIWSSKEPLMVCDLVDIARGRHLPVRFRRTRSG